MKVAWLPQLGSCETDPADLWRLVPWAFSSQQFGDLMLQQRIGWEGVTHDLYFWGPWFLGRSVVCWLCRRGFFCSIRVFLKIQRSCESWCFICPFRKKHFQVPIFFVFPKKINLLVTSVDPAKCEKRVSLWQLPLSLHLVNPAERTEISTGVPESVQAEGFFLRGVEDARQLVLSKWCW